MAIRMTNDRQDQPEFNDNQGGGGGGRMPGGGGGGGLFQFLPLILGLFRSKLGIGVLVIGAFAYFVFGQKGCGAGLMDTVSKFSTGGTLDPREFSKSAVYEGLTDDNTRNPLPEYISLAKFAPPRQNQGSQGSCVAWSAAYAAQTILNAASRGTNPTQQAFSPSYMYNQIGLDGCQGSYINRAMEFMTKKGGVPFNSFPYNPNDCSANPPQSLNPIAAEYKIHGHNRLTSTEDTKGINIRAVKEHLSKDAPVVIGMMVGGSFMEGMMGQKLWQPTSSDYQQMGFGGHAMAVIGYDDKLAGGAFQIMNSWGPEWGENGIGWVRYADFQKFVREAYGIDPLPKQGAALNQPFDCNIGLVQVDDAGKPKGYIPLKSSGSNLFSSSTVPKGLRFKVEVKNSNECYVYVFSRETDGSSYTLFPYPTQADPTKTAYSPYCGITGSRLFPKDISMTPDDVSPKEYVAIIVSKKELNWYELNKRISQNKTSYAAAVSSALSGDATSKISVSSNNTGSIRFTAPGGENGLAYAIIEMNK